MSGAVVKFTPNPAKVKLLPCPICGAEDSQRVDCFMQFHSYYASVKCMYCRAVAGPVNNENRELARSLVIAKWNGLPRSLKWTTEKPTDNNNREFFFYKEGRYEDPYIVFIQKASDLKTTFLIAQSSFTEQNVMRVSDMNGFWAGPIQKPMAYHPTEDALK